MNSLTRCGTDPVGTALDVGGVLTGGAAAGARLPGTAGRLAQAIVKADPIAAGGRAVVAGGRAAETSYRGRRSTPSTKEFIEGAPGPEALQRQGSELFEAAEKSGVRFKADYYAQFADDLLSDLVDQGADTILSPKVSRVSDLLEKSKGRAPSIQEMSILRRQFGNAAGSADAAERRLASIAIDKIDDFVESGASSVGGTLTEARGLWSRLKKSEILDRAIENARRRKPGSRRDYETSSARFTRLAAQRKCAGFPTPS